MARDFEYYQTKVANMIANDNKSELFFAIDDMFHGNIDLPPQLKEFGDIRLNKDSTPHDALYNATTALSNSKVKLEIMPLGDSPKEYERANMQEEVLTWHWEQANMRGMARKIFEIAQSALRYDLCVTRTEDLLWWLPADRNKWSKANKRAARNGRFIVTVLPPHSVFFSMSPLGGTNCVVIARNLLLSEVVDYYEGLAGTNAEGKKIKATIAKLRKESEDTYETQRFMLYDYTDDEKRLVYGHLVDSVGNRASKSRQGRNSQDVETNIDSTGGGDNEYVLIDTENKLPFINYTIRGGQSNVEVDPSYRYHPMLASAHWHGLWTDAVLAKSLTFSDIIRRLREVRATYEGVGTDQVPPDDGSGGDKALPPGVTRKVQQPTTIDSQAFAIIQDYVGSLNKTTGTSILGNLNQISGSTPYSSIQAQIQLALGNINPQRNIIQDTIRDVVFIFCEWGKFTKKPLQAWRTSEKMVNGTKMPRGQDMQMAPEDYDLDEMHISCTITPETPTDLTQRINNARLLTDMGMSKRDALDSLNVPHPEMQLDISASEQLKMGAVQAKITEMNARANAKVQVETQQAMAQLAQSQQPQPTDASQAPGTAAPAPSPFDMAGGAGNDPNQGGQPPIMNTGSMGPQQTTPNGQDVVA